MLAGLENLAAALGLPLAELLGRTARIVHGTPTGESNTIATGAAVSEFLIYRVYVGDDPNGGWIFAVIGIVIGMLLVVALLLPASRDYCWGQKPGL